MKLNPETAPIDISKYSPCQKSSVGCSIGTYEHLKASSNIKECCLFVLFVTLRAPNPWCPPCALGTLGKPLMSRGAPRVVCNV